MKNIVSRYLLLCTLGVVAFVPLSGILSPGRSSSQQVPSVAPEVSLKQLSPSVSQKQVPRQPAQSTQRYTSSTYRITFSYPSNWQPSPLPSLWGKTLIFRGCILENSSIYLRVMKER